ncbi:histidine triad nucleotide-binding protein [Lysobacter sp. N42]|jgi:diadenosine tetraphosphate (Ap4A) HIT family hydrolase|uniref:histidine triad nucleotide-binding protein n=1 Tax=Lysobacter sp. N42 TaxID=2545719 RepID=UPI00104CFB94|nr:histidine triad nucleotide-binding protein [Lysobacter sp. N42]TCZ82267.1 histidine triad nucleotide-binding protein [Lysobacter sp. N42]
MATDTTIFGKIIRREVPADIVFEDEQLIAFRDIAPSAPVHVLFVPKTPIASLDAAQPAHAELLGRLMLAAAEYARTQGLAQDGYRVVVNCGPDAGQTVFQLHLHLLAGAPLGPFGKR